jgi:hypothetical protein
LRRNATIHNLLELELGFVDTGDILERHLGIILDVDHSLSVGEGRRSEVPSICSRGAHEDIIVDSLDPWRDLDCHS